MPHQPGTSAVSQDKFLTDMSVANVNDPMGFVADRVFPVVAAPNISGAYPIYTAADWNRDVAQRVPLGGAPVRSGFNITSGSYSCEEWGIEHAIPDAVSKNADDPIKPDEDGAAFVAEAIKIRRERRFAAAYFVTGVWGTTLDVSGTTQWDTASGSDPIGQIKTARLTVQLAIGRMPNYILMNLNVFEALAEHPDIKEKFKYTSSDSVTTDMLARVFHVDEVIVGSAVYETADEGATSSRAHALGNHCLVGYRAPRPSLRMPSCGYTITWSGTGNAQGISVDRYRDEKHRSDVIRAFDYSDIKLVSSDAGYMLLDAVSA
jgi:hypothetical protein